MIGIVTLLGMPGSGKGIQARLLAERYRMARVSAGELFRKGMAQGGAFSEEIKSYVEKGEFVPDEVAMPVVVACIREAIGEMDGVVLDGVPRTIAQAVCLDAELDYINRNVDTAVYLRISVEEACRRISERFVCRGCQRPVGHSDLRVRCEECGGELIRRADDLPDATQNRIRSYLDHIANLIEYYRTRHALVEVNADQGSAQVCEEIGVKISALKVV